MLSQSGVESIHSLNSMATLLVDYRTYSTLVGCDILWNRMDLTERV